MTTPGNDLFLRLARALAGTGGASSDFDLNPDTVLPPGRKLRPAGVLIGLIERPGGAHLVLTKRSSRLKHHPGQIAFPGGKQEAGDDGPVGAALRETAEEIGLASDKVEVMGILPVHETVTGFNITPVLGRIRAEFTPVPEAGEVDEIFTVPFAHVADRARYSVQSRMWRGAPRHYYTVPYGPYYIWGATARILRGLADRLECAQ